MVGVATVDRPTVRVKAVVVLTPPPAAVTVIVDIPAGVDALVLMLRVVEQDGLQEAADSEAIVPAGKPEILKETGWVAPEIKDVVIELGTEEPAVTETLPELDKEKLNGWVTVNEALAGALPLYPPLNAAALMRALLVRVIAPT